MTCPLPSRILLLTLVACTLGACTTTRPRTGRSAFEMLGAPPDVLHSPPSAAAAQPTAERIEYIPAHALQPLLPPAYPPAALAAGAGDYEAYITVTVDEQGTVTDVAPSWQRVRLAHPQAGAFLQAIKDAVARWELSPAHQVYYRPGPEGEDEYVRTEAVPETFEMRFAFEAAGAGR